MTRTLVLAVPLLLGACAGWPTGSYVAQISDKDAIILAPVIAAYASRTLAPSNAVYVISASADDPIGRQLPPALQRVGLHQDQAGRHLEFLAAPLGSGVLLRVSIDNKEGASQYFARASNQALQPGGPMTVAEP